MGLNPVEFNLVGQLQQSCHVADCNPVINSTNILPFLSTIHLFILKDKLIFFYYSGEQCLPTPLRYY